jgi:hypothetical protein
MAAKNSIETQLRIEGVVDPSVKRALESTHTALENFKNQTSEITNKLNSMWSAAAVGGVVGGTVAAAWGRVTSVIEGTIDKVREFGTESLRVARQADRQLGAFGRTINNAKAASMLEERFAKLGMATFGGSKLMDIAGRLSRFGVKQRYLQGTTMELAAVAQGANTGEEGLNQLTDVYGRVRGRGYVTLRDLQAAEKAGVSREDILKFAGGSEDKLAQMIKDKAFTSTLFSKVLQSETQGSGRYANALKKAEDSFNGQSNLIQHHMEELEKLWGRIEEKLLKPMLQWFNNSGIWEAADEWMAKANKWADGILEYFRQSDVGQRFTEAFAPVRKAWDDFSRWLDGFFSTDAMGGKHLNAKGKEELDAAFKAITDIIAGTMTFLTSEEMKACASFAWDTATTVLSEVFRNIEELIILTGDFLRGDAVRFGEDFKALEVEGKDPNQ